MNFQNPTDSQLMLQMLINSVFGNYQGIIKQDGMQNPVNGQYPMPAMNFYGANQAIYQNQQRLGNDGNMNGIGNGQAVTPGTNNQSINNSNFLEGSPATYKQFLKNNNSMSKGSSQQLGELNTSPNAVIGGGHHAATVSQFKNKKIIVKHSNIVKKKRQIKIWTPEEDELLKHLYEQLPGKWNEIAVQISGRNASQCSQRWRRILPTKIRKPWTNEEDQKVLELSEKYGKNWGMIAQHIEGKTGKQVRERYINKLDPTIKRTPWSEEEDQKILDMFLEQGAKWSAISNELIGRPENTVKNRFYSHISRIYLSEESAYLSNKNTDNTQKVKDACAKLPHSQHVKKPLPKKSHLLPNQQETMEEQDDDEYENEDDNEDEEDDEGEECDDEEEENEDQIEEENKINNNNQTGQAGSSVQSNNLEGGNLQQKSIKKKLSQKESGNKQTGIGNTVGRNNITSGLGGNAQTNDDRKNLKIEEQDDSEEELIEGHINNQEKDTHPRQPLPAQCGFEPLAKSEEKQQEKQKAGLSLITNPMLAKRGKMIQNIEIPKVNNQENMQNMQQNNPNENNNNNNPSNFNNSRNNGNQLSNNNNNNNQMPNKEGDNSMAGMGIISNSNLDFMNNNTPQPYFGNIALFNQQLTPLYPHQMHPQQFQQLQQLSQQQQQIPMQVQQQQAQTPLETASPMFVLANTINSPAPRSSLPLFKPPMTSIGNTTPSAITPLMTNNYGQYIVYNPNQSLGMLTPTPFPAYGQMINPYLIKNQNSSVFSSLAKLGQNTHNDIDKTPLENTDQNFLSILHNQNNSNNNNINANGNNNYGNNGIQTKINGNSNIPQNANNIQHNFQNPYDQMHMQQQQQMQQNLSSMSTVNFPSNVTQQSTGSSNPNEVYSNNANHQQPSHLDTAKTQVTDEKTNQFWQFVESPLSTLQPGFIGIQQNHAALNAEQKGTNNENEPTKKSQLEHLLKEFTQMDPEQKKKFQMMISGQSPEEITKGEQQSQQQQQYQQQSIPLTASVKEESMRNSFASPE